MKQFNRIYHGILLTLFSTILHAQGSHWKVDAHQFQFDMTAYAQVVYASTVLTDFSDVEIAAFVGDECRGVLVPLSLGDYHYGYIRIRSNQPSGETVTFKVFDKVTQKEILSSTTVTFEASKVYGFPSSPLSILVGGVLLGDADEDGAVTIADIVHLIDYLRCLELSIPYAGKFNTYAADVNCDGVVSLLDVEALHLRLLQLTKPVDTPSTP